MSQTQPQHHIQRPSGMTCRLCSLAIRITPLAFAVFFLALCIICDSEAGWIHVFDFVSFARKYSHVSPWPGAFSFAAGVAIGAGMLMGSFCALLGKWNSHGVRFALSKWPRWLKIISVVFLPGIAIVPFLELGQFDALSRHDRITAAILGNQLGTAVFVAALNIGYFGFYFLIAFLIRDFVARSSAR